MEARQLELQRKWIEVVFSTSSSIPAKEFNPERTKQTQKQTKDHTRPRRTYKEQTVKFRRDVDYAVLYEYIDSKTTRDYTDV